MKLNYDCRECQMKHLRAALAYAVRMRDDWEQWTRCLVSPTFVGELSRAAVLLAESVHTEYAGYADLAYGTLVVAEEVAAANGIPRETVETVREIRRELDLTGCNVSSGSLVLGRLHAMAEPFAKDHYVDLFYGHLLEARREGFRCMPGYVTPKEYVVNFEEYVKAVGKDPADAPEGKGGEVKMACKKCAAKGGKTAKAAKGGKTAKKGCK